MKSGKIKEHKPKVLGPDIFRWGGVLPREGVGAKKFGMFLETQKTKLLGGISRDFAGISQPLTTHTPLNKGVEVHPLTQEGKALFL